MTTTDTPTALDRLDAAIEAVLDARDLLTDSPTFTGTHQPGSEGHVGQLLHDLYVLRGRVADPALSA